MKAVDTTNWNNKNAVLHAVNIDYERLQKSGISPIEKISDELLVERDVAMAALGKDWHLTLFLLKQLAEQDSHPQCLLAQSLLGDRVFMLTALQEKEAHRLHRGGRSFNADNSVAYYASAALQNDREFMLALVNKFGAEIEKASKRLQGDPELVLIAIRNEPTAIEDITLEGNKALQTNPAIVLAKLASNPGEAQYANLSNKQWAEIAQAWQAQQAGQREAGGTTDNSRWTHSVRPNSSHSMTRGGSIRANNDN